MKKRLKSLTSWLLSLRLGKHSSLIAMAILVGVLSGGANMLFRFTLEWTRNTIFHGGSELLGIHKGGIYRLLIPLLPITGALLLIPLSYKFPGMVNGYGFPAFLEKVNIKDGIIKLRTIFLKIIAPALTIGSGGSAGVEGPIAQIGGGLGSLTGQLFKVSGNRMKLLIAAGAAGGIAATFNAPIAGVMFATEIVLLGNFELTSFGVIVISSGIATVISRIYYGSNPAFIVPQYELEGLLETPLYLVMGLFIGPVAVLYTKFFYKVKERFESANINPYLKPVVGALMVGTIGILLPQTMGDGYEYIEEALKGNMVFSIMFLLIFLKILATSITLGSGGAGGVFAPALFIGAMTGGAFGVVVNYLFPAYTSSPGAYAMVGVGSFLAAVTHAPLTGMFLLFEMTGNYKIIIPTMFATTIGTFVAHRLFSESIDTFELSKRGINIHAGREATLLSSIKVRDVMRRDFTPVRDKVNLKEFLELVINGGGGFYYPVVDSKGDMLGIISLQDMRRVLFEDYIKEIVTVGELATEDVLVLTPDDNLTTAMKNFALMDIEEIPVVAPDNNKKVIGMLRRGDVIAVYNREILRKHSI
ncbi:Chloride channel protein [hydrothermal vent metagenome]|uniref:Chloride channel protein n=1 Tax=hydrothermal vent metagenome TaxID=652676 RepID=A0A3B1D164_9ZZZZ